MHNRLDFDAIQREIASRLDPDSIAIDGRDLRDRLAFVASVAELIIYYDENNTAKGNWLSLLLKDPAIMLAVISKTDYQAMHLRFSQLHHAITEEKQRLQTKAETDNTSDNQAADAEHLEQAALVKLDNALRQLLTLLDQLFDHINHWWHHLNQNNTQFPLRNYIDKQITRQLAQLLYQRLSLQTYIAKELPDCLNDYPVFSTSHFAEIWQVAPSYPQPPATIVEALGKLEAIYAVVFQFFVQVINEARPAFYKLVYAQNDFPDTSLIIACNELLKYSQSGLNQFSQKHLQFYYQKLLRQRPASAQPDFTYVCVGLNEKTPSINLPQGTAFIAGTYPDKSPVLFENDLETELNQISLIQIQSNNYLKTEASNSTSTSTALAGKNGTTTQPQFTTYNEITSILPDSTQVRRNQQGQILNSQWFGMNSGTAIQQGFVLASPMFYLSGGLRTITLTLDLATPVTPENWENLNVALSSTKGWQNVPFISDSDLAGEPPISHLVIDNSSTDTCLILDIFLNESFAPVSTFKKPPEGYSAEQYYCKVILPDTIDLATQVKIKQLSIEVAVFNCQNLALSTDDALLINNKPMSIFGSTADVGSQCFVSSPEAFSKPLTELALTLDWENLEENISSYYQPYNDYLIEQSLLKTDGELDDAALLKVQEELKDNNSENQHYKNDAYKVCWSADTSSGWQPHDSELLSEAQLEQLQTKETTFTALKDDEGEGQNTSKDDKSSSDAPAKKQHQPFFKRVFNALKGEAIHIKEKVEHIADDIKDGVEHLKDGIEHLKDEAEEKLHDLKEDVEDKLHEAKDKVEDLLHIHHDHESEDKNTGDSDIVVTDTSQTLLFTDEDGKNAPQSIFCLKFDSEFRFGEQLPTALPSNKNPSLRFTLTEPSDPFGSAMYASLVSYTTMKNAEVVMSKFAKPVSTTIKISLNLLRSKNKNSDDVPQELSPLPNPPYIVKARQALIHYAATQSIDFTKESPSMTQDFSLFHIGNPNTYAYFQQSEGNLQPDIDFRQVQMQPPMTSTTQQQSDNKAAPPLEGCALFQGVSTPADNINISLQKIEAPCRLNLYIELAQNIGFEQTSSKISLFYWSVKGWQPLSVLSDGTEAFSRSGILTLDIPEDIWLDSSVFTPPSKKPPPAPLLQSQLLITHQGKRSVSVVYCNTQGVKLTRATPIQLPIGETPNLAALSISKTQEKNPAISSLIQPFSSVPGLPAESLTLFRQRVSQRLKTKDRGSNVQDFVSLIKHTDPAIFFVRRLTSTAGNVKLGLVQGYSSADVSNAFLPVVPRANMAILQDALNKRVSAMCRVQLSNLQHQSLQVKTTLIISENSNANELQKALQTGIALYLSPWIKARQSQYCISDGLSKADLTRFIASFSDVLAVESLEFPGLEGEPDDSVDILSLPNEQSIWVTAPEHDISFTRSQFSASEGNGIVAPSITLPQNVLTGGSV